MGHEHWSSHSSSSTYTLFFSNHPVPCSPTGQQMSWKGHCMCSVLHLRCAPKSGLDFGSSCVLCLAATFSLLPVAPNQLKPRCSLPSKNFIPGDPFLSGASAVKFWFPLLSSTGLRLMIYLLRLSLPYLWKFCSRVNYSISKERGNYLYLC